MSSRSDRERERSIIVVGGSFTDDATRAMAASPRYFSWWYSIKSIALVGAIGTAAYFAGKASARREVLRDRVTIEGP